MATITYSYIDCPTIEAFSEDRHFIRGLMGPYGSGKSSGCIIQIIERAFEQQPDPLDGVRRVRWAVIRNTYQQLRDTAIRTVMQWLPEYEFGRFYSSEHRYVITGFAGVEIELLFRALDRPDQVDNLKSLELTGAWINEACEIPWAIVEALIGRVGRFPAKKDGGCSYPCIIADTNPPDEDSWWYSLFEVKRPSDVAIFKQPGGLTPLAENIKNLPANYYERMVSTMSPERAKIYVHGQYGFVIDGKPVFPEYNDGLHCSDKFDYVPGLPIYRGWDFGLTPACVFTQITPKGIWQIFDELVAQSLGFDRFSDEVILHIGQKYPDATFIDLADPAGMAKAQTDEKTCFQIANAKGIVMQPGAQDPQIRQESVRKPLMQLADGRPALQLHPRCKMLRKGFMGGYQFRRLQTNGERFTDEPDKNMYSHPHDALQYVATRLYGSQLTSRKQASKPIVYPNKGGYI